MQADEAHDRIAVVEHTMFTSQAGFDLVTYLNTHLRPSVLHVRHRFGDATSRRSEVDQYVRGQLIGSQCTSDLRWLPELLVYVKEFLTTLRWVSNDRRQRTCVVALDGLCALFALVARAFGRVSNVVLWNIDFVPRGRFESNVKNAIYRAVNKAVASRVDEVWDLTDLMVRERAAHVGLTTANYRSHRVVPIGIWFDRIERVPYVRCERNTLVFLGHLTAKQGVQLVIRAISLIVPALPAFRFKVIGAGPFESELRTLARNLNVESHVSFVGHRAHDAALERELALCGAGIAPYVSELDTFTQFGADPGKIKTYLGCGLPVLVTDVPYIARDIVRRECGLIVTESSEDIAAKVTAVLSDPDVNQKFRDGAARFGHEFDYEAVFGRTGL